MRLTLPSAGWVLLAGMAGLVGWLGLRTWHRVDSMVVEPRQIVLPADGRVHDALRLRMRRGWPLPADIQGSGVGLRLVPVGDGELAGLVQAPVMPGGSSIRLRARGRALSVPIRFVFDARDGYGDGTPDFLRLHTAEDQEAFRRWFTALAEGTARLSPDKLPAEIDDCAALLRYAYREALRKHDEAWLAGQSEEMNLAMPSVHQYQYPETPLGASIFRVKPGEFIEADLRDGSFAQFADARTLMALNTHLVGRVVGVAQAGDLLFFRQLEQNSQYHSMIVSGQHADWVVYHTGPIGKMKGEVRRVSVEDLLHHPDARWRPLPENSNFLGVYRWNILRDPN